MKKEMSFFNYSENRSTIINILCFLFAIAGLFILPILFSSFFNAIFSSKQLSSILANFLFIFILVLCYIKDLKRELKTFKSNFRKNIKIAFKYYFCGFLLMVFFNIIIQKIFSAGVSANEQEIRKILFTFPLYSVISISLIAPISEELIFRKSLMPLLKNKWLYSLTSGILFGAPHLLAGSFTLSNLIFILPYGSLGFMFAYMNYETRTTFSSMFVHFIHNTFTIILYFIANSAGAL